MRKQVITIIQGENGETAHVGVSFVAALIVTVGFTLVKYFDYENNVKNYITLHPVFSNLIFISIMIGVLFVTLYIESFLEKRIAKNKDVHD